MKDPYGGWPIGMERAVSQASRRDPEWKLHLAEGKEQLIQEVSNYQFLFSLFKSE